VTELQRFVRRLVEALRERDPEGVHRPIEVGELRRSLIPYRLQRNALSLTSSEDYELLVLRLCAEEGGYVRTFPPEAAERCRAELASPNPDLGLVEGLADATIQIGAAALGRLLTSEDGGAPLVSPQPAARTEPPEPPPAVDAAKPIDEAPVRREEPAARVPLRAEAPRVEPPARVSLRAEIPGAEPPARASLRAEAPGAEPPARVSLRSEAPRAERCRFCAATLPAGRTVVFCPFCGHQLLPVTCSRCGAEVEPGWRHCISCGLALGAGGVNA
jgi:hypothetical protein